MLLSYAIVDFIYSMMELFICKYEPFWQEISVESMIHRWPFRRLLLNIHFVCSWDLVIPKTNHAVVQAVNWVCLLKIDTSQIISLSRKKIITTNVYFRWIGYTAWRFIEKFTIENISYDNG